MQLGEREVSLDEKVGEMNVDIQGFQVVAPICVD
jgi:hypothetical protein